MIVSNYKEAVDYVTKNYWVEPVFFPPTASAHEQVFEREWIISDSTESGLVHYVKK